MEIAMQIFRQPAAPDVHRLLNDSDLPTADLTSQNFEHFFGCGSKQESKGVVGLEIYGSRALLRSLVVCESNRGRGCGKALVAEAERYAQGRGVRYIYLLTITAAKFFEGLGYTATAREEAPESIRATSEFSNLCPSSSAFMIKDLTPNHANSADTKSRGEIGGQIFIL
ncbi:MAG: GNAT family N-acetyltransferase [Deltaproteobacteria bacterium]|nr:GNAT family N-acetyltransferase [Deltaproteobacteria bacterium]